MLQPMVMSSIYPVDNAQVDALVEKKEGEKEEGVKKAPQAGKCNCGWHW